MIAYMTRRISLVFYRASTYRGLVELFCIVCYVFALLFFFGTISRKDGQVPLDVLAQSPAGANDAPPGAMNNTSLVVTKYDIERARSGRNGMIEAGKDVLRRALDKDTITEVRIEQ